MSWRVTKAEVKETYGLLQPKVWRTPEGQEVWHYKSPVKQNVYFKDDKVERVEYVPETREKYPPDIGEPKGI
ncbi:MAG: hypothetical protein KAI96_06895 [Thermodesulfovibrionia bacterium]|nr:hypothetical protein [Thermodesulfovibrionia bacterium]